MAKVKIDTIVLKNNDNVDSIKCKPLNIIVGANNTGKSQLLKDLGQLASSFRVEPSLKWLAGATFEVNQPTELINNLFGSIDLNQDFDDIRRLLQSDPSVSFYGINFERQTHQEITRSLPDSISYEVSPNNNITSNYYTTKLIVNSALSVELCLERISGPFETNYNDLGVDVRDIVHYLLINNDSIFKEFSKQVKEAFQKELVFDDLLSGHKPLRFKPSLKQNAVQRRSYTAKKQYWVDNSALLSDQGDGIKAYVKILYSFFNKSKNIVLIDEPEAFLHPPQRRILGEFLASNIVTGKQLFIATHDPEFLRGILTSDIDRNSIQIIYLKEKAPERSYSILQLEDLRHSIEYNENILNSFFNNKTVLCEAEDDRMIFQYAAKHYFPKATIDIHFTGHNGKAEVLKILKILKRKNVDASAILDIDLLYSPELTVRGIGYDSEELPILNETRTKLITLLNDDSTGGDDKNKKRFQELGISYPMQDELKNLVNTSINILEKKGIYLIKTGTVETLVEARKGSKMVQTAINTIQRKRKMEIRRMISKIING